MALTLGEMASRCLTCDGKKIYKDQTDQENLIRSIASHINWPLIRFLSTEKVQNEVFQLILSTLRREKSNPLHYGDNKPGLFFENRTPVYPDPQFSYWDLYQFGVSGEGGYSGFLKDAKLPPETANLHLMACVGLLLVADAVSALDIDNPYLSSKLLFEAQFVLEGIYRALGIEHAVQEQRQHSHAKGANALHAETNEFKEKVIDRWRSGEFKTKADCARWALKQFPIKNAETVNRWLRAYEKNH